MWNLTRVPRDNTENQASQESEPEPQMGSISLESVDNGGRYPKQVEIQVIKNHISRLKKSYYAVRPAHKQSFGTSTDQQTSVDETQQSNRKHIRTAVDHWVMESSEDPMGPTYAPVRRQNKTSENRRYKQGTKRPVHRRSQTIEVPEDNFEVPVRSHKRTYTRPMTREQSPESLRTTKKGEFVSLQYRQAKHINAATNLQQYQSNVKLLKKLYDDLSELTISVKRLDKEQHISGLARSYLQLVFCTGLGFLDSLLEVCQTKEKRTIQMAQLLERLSICYLMLEVVKGDMQLHIGTLVNMLGHCSSSLILLSRLYILKMKCKYRQQLPPTNFEVCIRRYQLSTYRTELFQPEGVLRRMQHNNDILIMLQNKVGTSNHRFSNAAKLLIRQPQRQLSSVWMCSRHLLEYLAYYLHDVGLNGRARFLDCAPGPYLKPSTQDKYTILVEPHGVLFFYRQGEVVLRSFAKQFFDYVCKHFELIIWSWLMPQELQAVLDLLLQEEKPVQFGMLYRYHCQESNGLYSKNLNRLGRDLSKVLLIDYDQRIYRHTPQNGVQAGWNGDEKEAKLLDLSQILLEILTQGLSIPEALSTYRQEISRLNGSLSNKPNGHR